MASLKVFVVVALLVAVAFADERPYGEPSEESYEDAKYEFEWQVSEDSNEFGQQESRDGDNTQGSYYVELPDGRRQTVTYYVDGDSGYVAEVKYSGEAEFPEESGEGGYDSRK